VEITEVRVKLMEDPDDRLRAFCSITFDNCFVVRDLKIIEGATGPFVAMPSRKLTSHCAKCGTKNHLRANYCNQCGGRLREHAQREGEGRAKLYADIAHPINSECRELIQNRVIQEFQAELERSNEPGYVSRYDDEYGEGDYEPGDFEPEATPQSRSAPPEDRTVRADAPEPPPAPHAPPQRETQKEASKKTTFGEGIFDENQP
jgi:stage V sporulation protein G